MSKKKNMFIGLMILGVALFILGIIFESPMTTFLIAFGSGLFGGGLAKFLIYDRLGKNPEKEKAYEISQNDPRNKEIRSIAYAKSGYYLQFFVIILGAVASFTNQPLWMVISLFAAFIIYQFLVYYYMAKLNSKM
ncbi:hypothetical protein G7081_06660 [Vagococcus coleopterorum]|uniref:DUF2178 domain-containing protein n=1 Tax=Vagococcus coleopterorum TaxID=2714946 RepID=A0A6G8AP49_9ENTE|nr:hypothetical protein [Vagococcus coleopterorum]QIL46767.1 hypothetical protein G7081_06660 [Vagococcus coleopterorum]